MEPQAAACSSPGCFSPGAAAALPWGPATALLSAASPQPRVSTQQNLLLLLLCQGRQHQAPRLGSIL